MYSHGRYRGCGGCYPLTRALSAKVRCFFFHAIHVQLYQKNLEYVSSSGTKHLQPQNCALFPRVVGVATNCLYSSSTRTPKRNEKETFFYTTLTCDDSSAWHLPAQGNFASLAAVAGAGAVADGGVEPEELERAPAARAGGGFPGPAAARGEVPHELLEPPADAVLVLVLVLARRGFFCASEDTVQEGHGVAELPVHVLRRTLPLPPLLSLSVPGKRKWLRRTCPRQEMGRDVPNRGTRGRFVFL